jgi:hypothetical protein
MSLHIFLGDEELLYFIVRVEVIKIQIWLEFKLVCNLQNGLKFYKGFSIFLRRIGPNSRSRPSRPPLARGPQTVQRAVERPGQPHGHAPISRSPIQPVKRLSDPISLEPNPNPLPYLLSHSFKPILFLF